MSRLYNLLLVLITTRLLATPGICLCQAASPAVEAVFRLLGKEAPLPVQEPFEDHDPGCPASGLSEAMGLQPSSPPLFPPLAVSLASLAEPSSQGHFVPSQALCPDQEPGSLSIRLIICALLI